jgi:hypothetical protein
LSGGAKASAADRNLPPRNAGQSALAGWDGSVVIVTTARAAKAKVNLGMVKVPVMCLFFEPERGL